ncbi:MAG: molybdopterin-dependent oxidoreductase, partial [Candidatus Dormibacteraeota bacterium]|nr:molybdopterin-dependent oxidoreductase [Candidatus Dormibacteraeota bacterium]
MTEAPFHGWIGRSVPRREDPPLLRGEGRYSADAEPPETLHLAIRRAGIPHGSGLAVDLAPALAMPGVAGAWRAGELGLADDFMPDATPQPPPIRRPIIASGAVRFEGDAVAVVAAETEYQAHDAVDAIGVDLAEAAPARDPIGVQRFTAGDPATAFAGAPVTVRERLRMGRICGAAIEPRAVLAEWREAEQQVWVRATTGGVHVLRDALCHCLGLERNQVVVVSDDVGGSFGAKNNPYPEYIVAAAVSR